MTLETLKVLRVMLEYPGEKHYGLEIAKQTGIASGSLYPILIRLENNGWVESEWEDINPKEIGRKPRRYYRLTGLGIRSAKDAFLEHGLRVGVIQSGEKHEFA